MRLRSPKIHSQWAGEAGESMVKFQSKPKGPRTRTDGIISSPKTSTFETQEEPKRSWCFIYDSGLCEQKWSTAIPGYPPKPPTHDSSCSFPLHCPRAGCLETRHWRCWTRMVSLIRNTYFVFYVSKKYTFLLFEPLHILKSIYNSLSEESYFLFIQFHLMVGFSLNSENLIMEYLFLKGNERSWENMSNVSSHLHCSAF